MVGALVAVSALLVIGYTLLVRPIAAAHITYPMLSLLAGVIFFSFSDERAIPPSAVLLIAEVTLVVVLFHDASTVRIRKLRTDSGLSLRLLGVGFPLALAVTFAGVALAFPELSAMGVLLIAAAITPTDAGLGAATVLNPVVPARVRRALNVESGLNDGLATPIVLIALGSLATSAGDRQIGLLSVGVIPVTLALVISIPFAIVVAKALDASRKHHFSSPVSRAVAVFAVPLAIFGFAELAGANAFIAAFVGGLTFGAASTTMHENHDSAALLVTAAELLGFAVWFLGGGLLLLIFSAEFHWQWLAIAVLALTLFRVLPVAISLLGTGFHWPTVAFLGWFGPRGLASIVFVLLSVEELDEGHPVIGDLAGVVATTVLLSVLAHGFSAGPLAARYGRWARDVGAPVEGEPSTMTVRSRGRSWH